MAKKRTAKPRGEADLARKKTVRVRKQATAVRSPVIADPTSTLFGRAELDALSIGTDDAIQWLLDETHERELTALLGKEQLPTMQLLAKEANRVEPFRRMAQVSSRNALAPGQADRAWFYPTRPGATKVIILPGILGSTLAIGDDTIWFDPIDIARGKMASLKRTANDRVVSNGVFTPTYLKLFLQTWRAGLNPEYFHYDWRKPIETAADRLVVRLKEAQRSKMDVVLVAHSMGGLVSRVALKQLGSQAEKLVKRTILLGTPNQGSFAPALVLLGENSMVQWMSWLHGLGGAGDPTADIFATFTGLYQMLPDQTLTNGVNLFDSAFYPKNVASPTVLKAARNFQSTLESGNERMHMVVGTGFETVVGLQRDENHKLSISLADGDETVPLNMAVLNGAYNYFHSASHGKLPSTSAVIDGVIELAWDGKTDLLEKTPPTESRSILRNVTNLPIPNSLREAKLDRRTFADVSADELRASLAPFLGVDGSKSKVALQPSGGDERAVSLSGEPVIVGRKRQKRLDVRLAFGDITQAAGRAILLGVFSDVRPGGAALAIDRRIGGSISEVIDRRMFAANLGEVFVLPTRRGAIQAEMVVMVGLGSFAQLGEKTIKLAVENSVRTMLRCDVDEIVSVLMGTGANNMNLDASIRAIFAGMIDAMKDAGNTSSLRALTLCHNNPTTYRQLQREIRELAFSPTLDDMEIAIDSIELTKPFDVPDARGISSKSPVPTTYLTVRRIVDPTSGSSKKSTCRLDLSLLPAGSNSSVLSRSVDIDEKALETLLSDIKQATSRGGAGFGGLEALGIELSKVVLDESTQEALGRLSPSALTIINDAWASRIPWELLTLPTHADPSQFWRAGMEGKVSRRYASANLSVAKWLRERRVASELSMLLIVNPTGDLEGAEDEGKRIEEMVKAMRYVRYKRLHRSEANKRTLLKEIGSGDYDVIHYAGHAFFDQNNRANSGLLCSDRSVLSGRDLAELDRLPALAVFNACESGRVRSAAMPSSAVEASRVTKAKAKPIVDKARPEEFDRNVSFAESFLRGGIAGFIGTYWPVGDSAAETFAKIFYEMILKGETVGAALGISRKKLLDNSEQDWANYIHYGDSEFRIKMPSDRQS